MGRDVVVTKTQVKEVEFQSTRPRGARQDDDDARDEEVHVSIHAPAWGATDGLNASLVILDVSIHAPAWGATQGIAKTGCTTRFQSTRPRGARHHSFTSVNLDASFNPRARVGRDVYTRAGGFAVTVFQSTRPRGARRNRRNRLTCVRGFQSTRPRGARPRKKVSITRATKFQSTRPRGARLFRVGDFYESYEVSIHAPAWGATGSTCRHSP